MIRLFYSAGVARIVEIQLNSLMTHKSMDAPMEPSATSVNRAVHGSAVTKTRTKRSAVSRTKNCEN